MIQCRGVDGRGELESIERFEFKSVHFFYPARPEVVKYTCWGVEALHALDVVVMGC